MSTGALHGMSEIFRKQSSPPTTPQQFLCHAMRLLTLARCMADVVHTYCMQPATQSTLRHWLECFVTWHDKGGTEGQLLILVEEVVGVLVKNHAADWLQREQVLRPDLGHVQRVKVKLVLILGVHRLHTPHGFHFTFQ